MIKYPAELAERYYRIKNCISINEELWKPFNITTETIEERIKKNVA